jgi:hypothetical protein
MRLPLTGTLTLTRTPTPNQVSWEMHEEYASEAETELGCDEDVLEGLFGGEDAEYDPEYDGAAKPSGSPKTKKHWLHGHTPPATKADKEAPKPPDMLSLSIAISILVKFILFDLVGFFQVSLHGTPSLMLCPLTPISLT